MTTKPTQCAQGYDCDACKGIEGMTLRDWFAGMAMNGLISVPVEDDQRTLTEIVSYSYSYADAMLKAGEQ